MTHDKTPKPESLEAKFKLMTILPYDKRAKRKHILVYGFILDWYHDKYGDALASARHILATLKERDPFEQGLYMGDVHSALTDLVSWGYLTQQKGAGRRASRYIPVWEKARSVHKTPNATEDGISVLDSPNASVRESPNATADSVHKIPNEDPLTGPVHKTGPQVMGSMFDAAPVAPPAVGPEATAAEPASGDGFDEFWKAWPRKHGLKKARAEWAKIGHDVDIIIEAAADWAAHYAKNGTDRKWIPEPANWLRDERWLEDLPLIHIDAKGAAITKAKANATPKAPEASNDNLSEDEDHESGPMVCDVGPFSPFGKFSATITGSKVEGIAPDTEKVVLDLTWNDRGVGPDVQHTLYFQHPDREVMERGRIFLTQLAKILDIADLKDTEQFHGRRVTCTINNRLAISYGRAA
ncbi:hypothetical protein [Rhizobium leguminosarum]